MRYRFVLNPNAGRARIANVRRSLEERFPGASFETVSEPTPEALRTRLRAGQGARAEVVVAVGGDGTVNRILNALGPGGPALGIIPTGTANDLARSLGIPTNLARACEVLRTGSLRRIDLASVNGSLFATCGGVGVAAAVAARADLWKRLRAWLRITRFLGRRLYAVAALRELARPLPKSVVTVCCPDRHEMRGALALLVSNQPRFGGRFSASPHASNQDGLLDVCALPLPRTLPGWARVFRAAWSGDIARLPGTRHGMAREMTVATSATTPFFGDGEILSRGRTFRISVLPGAARFVAPRAGGEG